MLNYVWSGMILLGIIVAAFTGRMQEVTNGALNSAKESITICIAVAGILCMWTGLMKIAEKSGLIDNAANKMTPLLKFLFPELKNNEMANKYIATNFIANFLGLGWASTPAGLKAMEEMQKVNRNKKLASRSMCMFMIINMSSLQIVTINILAYRSEYGSVNPSEIISLGIVATLASTLTGIICAKIAERWSYK
jgi:spore maturation protein A